MNAIWSFFKGKKTYIVALVTAGIAGWQALGHPVPESVWALLGALGMGTLRLGIGSSSK